jgi:hypothetical protein
VSPNEIDLRLNDLPFVPFRLYVSNGETYDVVHPDMVLVNLASVTLGIPVQTDPDITLDRKVTISLFHVVKIEPLGTAASNGS